MARTQDMTQGSPTKLILSFALPIILGNIFQQLYSLVDTLVVGRVEGVAALAAVSSAGWLDWMVLSIAMGLAQGFSIQIAQEFGAKDYAALRRAAGQGLILSVVVVIVLEILSQLSLHWLLVALDTPEDILHLTELYLRIIFGGMALVMGFNVFSGYLRAVGDSRTPLIAMTTAAVCNIILDVLFVAFFGWGVAGVAAATTISQGVSCTICLVALIRLPVMRLSRSDIKPHLPTMRRLIVLGMPIAFQNLIISVGGLVLQKVVNGFGFIFMAGFNAASRLMGIMELAGTSIGTAVGTFAGQNMGAGRLDRVRRGLKNSNWIALGIASFIAGIMAIFGWEILGFFIEDDPAIIDQVLTYGYRYLMFMSAGMPILYMLHVHRSTLQGLGDTIIPMVSGFVELVMRIGCILLLPALIGEWGVYTAEIMAWIGAGILLIICCWRTIGRMEKKA